MNRRVLTSMLALLALIIGLVPAQTSASAATYADWAQFVSDVTIPDGTTFKPGDTFTKTWRLKNIGNSTWTTSYTLVFSSGDKFGAPDSVAMPKSVAPGESVDISVNMTAPASSGHYYSYWKLKNASGAVFGIGATASSHFWAEINVLAASGVAFDFAAKACEARWISGAGVLPCPGTDGDAKGFVLKIDNPKLENGVTDSRPGLLTFPQNINNGYIQGIYPEVAIQKGDRFQSIVNCQRDATGCYVTFRLDYQIGNEAVKTFWIFAEKYEGLYYRADIDLSALAGKNVKFILTTLATGSAAADRAMWVGAVIARGSSTGPTATATKTNTPGGPTPTKTSTPASCTDKVQFISDVTIPDGTSFGPGATFTKTWRVKNVGTCTWNTSYNLVFVSGEKMEGADPTALTKNVAPNESVDITVNMKSPASNGTYYGYWQLKNPSGTLFGIGTAFSKPWWVKIVVTGSTSASPTPTKTGTPTTSGTVYDFYANACSATWTSGAGALPCPGTNGDAKGFLLKLDTPKLEDNTNGSAGLLTYPQGIDNGFIQGVYPAFAVKSGDRFQATVNCEYGATSCFVIFRLDYQVGTNPVKTFWVFGERYEGYVYKADKDLSSLAGQDVKFIFTVLANGPSTGDRAIWASPKIVRPAASSATATPTATLSSATATATPTVTATPTSATANWLTYTNVAYKFNFKYPPQGQLVSNTNNSAKITLPITAGTNLNEKYLDLQVVENANPCATNYVSTSSSMTSTIVTINGVSYLKQVGGDSGAGNVHNWVSYSTSKDNACVTFNFVLSSTNPDNFATPPAVFDMNAESVIFTDILNTFAWLP